MDENRGPAGDGTTRLVENVPAPAGDALVPHRDAVGFTINFSSAGRRPTSCTTGWYYSHRPEQKHARRMAFRRVRDAGDRHRLSAGTSRRYGANLDDIRRADIGAASVLRFLRTVCSGPVLTATYGVSGKDIRVTRTGARQLFSRFSALVHAGSSRTFSRAGSVAPLHAADKVGTTPMQPSRWHR